MLRIRTLREGVLDRWPAMADDGERGDVENWMVVREEPAVPGREQPAVFEFRFRGRNLTQLDEKTYEEAGSLRIIKLL